MFFFEFPPRTNGDALFFLLFLMSGIALACMLLCLWLGRILRREKERRQRAARLAEAKRAAEAARSSRASADSRLAAIARRKKERFRMRTLLMRIY